MRSNPGSDAFSPFGPYAVDSTYTNLGLIFDKVFQSYFNFSEVEVLLFEITASALATISWQTFCPSIVF